MVQEAPSGLLVPWPTHTAIPPILWALLVSLALHTDPLDCVTGQRHLVARYGLPYHDLHEPYLQPMPKHKSYPPEPIVILVDVFSILGNLSSNAPYLENNNIGRAHLWHVSSTSPIVWTMGWCFCRNWSNLLVDWHYWLAIMPAILHGMSVGGGWQMMAQQ